MSNGFTDELAGGQIVNLLLMNGRVEAPIEVLQRFEGVEIGGFGAASEGRTLDEKALQQFIRSKLADYKLPKQIIFLPALPRNATGKILKTELRKQVTVDRTQ